MKSYIRKQLPCGISGLLLIQNQSVLKFLLFLFFSSFRLRTRIRYVCLIVTALKLPDQFLAVVFITLSLTEGTLRKSLQVIRNTSLFAKIVVHLRWSDKLTYVLFFDNRDVFC